MQKLIDAAKVFNFIIPDWLEDDAVVGKIVGCSIHAGEVRRLRAALDEPTAPERKRPSFDRNHAVSLLRQRQRIEAIKYRRDCTGEALKEAKDAVGRIGLVERILEADSVCGTIRYRDGAWS